MHRTIVALSRAGFACACCGLVWGVPVSSWAQSMPSGAGAGPTPASAPLSKAEPGASTLKLGAGEQAQEAPAPVGLNLDLQLATAYVFRGWNVFQETSQMDPHLLLAPGLTYAIADTGLSVGYWGAYQLTGANIGATLDAALNAEQDLFVSYERDLGHDMTLAVRFFSYFYPAADRRVAGASVPTYLEPIVAFTASPGVDLGVQVTYFAGVQDAPGISGISYLYVNPSVGKSFELVEHIGLELLLGYGIKAFKEGNAGRSNVHDSAALRLAAHRPRWRRCLRQAGARPGVDERRGGRR